MCSHKDHGVENIVHVVIADSSFSPLHVKLRATNGLEKKLGVGDSRVDVEEDKVSWTKKNRHEHVNNREYAM